VIYCLDTQGGHLLSDAVARKLFDIKDGGKIKVSACLGSNLYSCRARDTIKSKDLTPNPPNLLSVIPVDNGINSATITRRAESKTSLHKWSTIQQTYASATYARYVITISEGPVRRGPATEYTRHHGKATHG